MAQRSKIVGMTTTEIEIELADRHVVKTLVALQSNEAWCAICPVANAITEALPDDLGTVEVVVTDINVYLYPNLDGQQVATLPIVLRDWINDFDEWAGKGTHDGQFSLRTPDDKTYPTLPAGKFTLELREGV